jgi:hypothetical protein
MSIPYERLGIPEVFQRSVAPTAPRSAKVAVAKGLLPTTANVQLALIYVLATDDDESVSAMARETLVGMPAQQVLAGISQQTFPKILEFITEFRKVDPEVDERIVHLRVATTRTVVRIAQRANADLCEVLSRHQERLLMSPEVFVALHGNEECASEHLGSAEAFLRMHKCLPEVPERRTFEADVVEEAPAPAATPAAAPVHESLAPAPAPVAPADGGAPSLLSPGPVGGTVAVEALTPPPQFTGESLQMFDLDAAGGADVPFVFDFEDDMADFSWDLTGDEEKEKVEEDQFLSMEQRIANMSVGEKIKLAYLGNKQARGLLIRDSNKIIASAVVKSGRLTDGEIESFAGNKNLPDEVLREISGNKSWTRKYPVKVALVNNPKTPVNQAMKILGFLHRRDLQQLSNNHGVPSVLKNAAKAMFKEKYQR